MTAYSARGVASRLGPDERTVFLRVANKPARARRPRDERTVFLRVANKPARARRPRPHDPERAASPQS
jgi:hypothetical protein